MADRDIMRQDDEGPRPQGRDHPVRFERPDPARAGRLRERRFAPLRTRSYLSPSGVRDVSAGLTALLADMFALYIKTKNFHWHVSGPGLPRLPSDARRAGEGNLRRDRRHRRTRPQARRTDLAIGRSDLTPLAHSRQRCRVRTCPRNAGRTPRRQRILVARLSRSMISSTSMATMPPPA